MPMFLFLYRGKKNLAEIGLRKTRLWSCFCEFVFSIVRINETIKLLDYFVFLTGNVLIMSAD